LRADRRGAASGLAALLCLIWLAPGCATHSGGERAVADSLYFGTAIRGGGEVRPREWQAFIDEVVTPRFPQGISSWQAAGQWRNRAGRVEKEPSHVLLIVHPDSLDDEQRIREIVSIYKQRFRQEAVLRVRSPARVSF